MAIALLAYGIASEAVLFPYEENKGIGSVGRLVSRAYWEIHGTLNLAEMAGGVCIYMYIHSHTSSITLREQSFRAVALIFPK